MRPPREDTQPWYKQFWPWFLISLPLSAVIASMFLIRMAITTSDGLVSDDYYKEGRAIYKNVARVEKARTLGIAGEIAYQADTGAISVRFINPVPEQPAQMTLDVVHPTIPNHDQSIALTKVDALHFSGRAEQLMAANWKLQLHPMDRSWRIEGRLHLPDNPVTSLN